LEERICLLGIWVNIWRGGHGSPLFVLTGLDGTFSIYRDLLEAFSKQGFDVYGIEFPGSGKSDVPPKDWSFYDFAYVVDAAIRHYGIPPKVVVVGHSWGSATALQFAGHFPDRLENLVIADAPVMFGGKLPIIHKGKVPLWLFMAGFWVAPGVIWAFKWTLISFKPVAKIVPFYRIWRVLHYSKVSFGVDWLRRLYVFFTQSDGVMRRVCRAWIEIDTAEDASLVSARTLLIWGERDWVTPPSNAKVLSDNLNKSTFTVIPGGTHHPSGEGADVFAGVVGKWARET